MNPRSLDPEAVRRRLVEIDRLLRWLSELGMPDGETLRRDWRTRLLVERILEQLVEMAVGVNLHLGSTLLVVTHDHRVAAYLDRHVTITDGRVLTPAETR